MRWITIISLFMLGLGILLFFAGLAFYINLFFNSSTSLVSGATCTLIGLFLIFGSIILISISKNPESDDTIPINDTPTLLPNIIVPINDTPTLLPTTIPINDPTILLNNLLPNTNNYIPTIILPTPIQM